MHLTVTADTPPAPSVVGPALPEPAAPGVASQRRQDHRGEGVISAAIAVLVMAFLGVGMWVAFNGTLNTAKNTVNRQVNCIGSSGPGC